MIHQPKLPQSPAATLAAIEHDALPAGTRFGEFEIIRVLGVGGFGIVYLAQDHSLERQVALKEYMPSLLAARGEGAMVRIRAASLAETYAMGLRSFINEARLLARFNHPSLVKVYRFWEDNGTAYMVMPYLEGRTLRDARRAIGKAPDEVWIRAVLEPLLDALEALHSEGVFHRDIAPDNILLPPEGLPILLDFGAARRVINDRTQSLTAIIKPSYAPIEQYAEMTAMRQGPWTDLYALGAVLYYLLFGEPPTPAVARAVQPELDANEQIEQRVVAGVSPRFVSVVAWMLRVRPAQRPQNVAALRAVLGGQLPVPSHLQGDVTLPGDTALMRPSVAPAAFDATQLDPARGTAHQDTVVMARPEAAVAWSSADRAVSSGSAPASGPSSASTSTSASASASASSAPMRSSPPGAVPPPYVPPRRAKKVAASGEALDAEAAHPARSMAPPSRARWIAGAAGAVAVAGVVLWQFIALIGGRGPALPNLADAVPLAATSVVSSAGSGAGSIVGSTAASVTTSNLSAVMPVGSRAASGAAEAQGGTRTATANGPVPLGPAPLVGDGEEIITEPAAHSTPPRPGRAHVGTSRLAAASTKRSESVAVAESHGLREECANRGFLSGAICVDRACGRPRFHDAPECVRIREEKRRREER